MWRTQRDRTLAPLSAKSSLATASKATSPRSSSGVIGKYGGLITWRNTVLERALLLVRTDDVTVPPPAASGREERQTLDVVPVEVGEEHRGVVPVGAALGLERVAVVAQPGAEIEHDRVVSVTRDLDARGVPPIPVELVAVARSRSAYPPEVHVSHSGHASTLPVATPGHFGTRNRVWAGRGPV